MADERRGQALVDRRGEHEHHQRTGVDEPVRDGPRDLDAPGRRELVRLVVPGVIERLVRRDDELERRLRDELLRRRVVGERSGDLAALLVVGDDDDARPLGEAAGGRPPNHPDDPLDHLVRDRSRLERAVHSPTGEDLAELHDRTV